MFVLTQIFIAVCPFIPLFYFATKIYRFDNILNKRRCIREKQISFKGVKDFSPKKIRQGLEKDSSILKRFIDEVLEAYQKLLLASFIYVIFWILYLVGIVVRVVWLFNNHYELLEPQELGCVMGSILMSILVLYWLLLTPIFEFFHWKKLSDLGYITWKFLQDMTEKIVDWFKQISKYICEFMVSFFPMYGYIFLVKKIFAIIQVEITFWIALLILMVYQYMGVKLFSCILQKIIMFMTKKISKLQGVEKYAKGEIMYLLLKNCTYLSMVFVYAVAVDSEQSSTPLAAALGVLFLIDTFLAQEKTIQEKVKKNNLEE